MRTKRLGLAAALLLTWQLSACGSGGDGDSGSSPDDSPASTPVTPLADLDGATYESTSVTGHELVPDTTVRVAFEGDTMSVSAGCNTLFGAVALTDDVLAWSGEPSTTLIGCEPDLAAQDAWLTDLFTSGVTPTTEGSTLTLASADVVIELEDVAMESLEPLLGRTWSVRGTVVDGVTSSIPSGVRRPRLEVGADGQALLDTGCNTGRTTVTTDGDQITFDPPAITRMACPGAAGEVEQTVLAVLDGTSDEVWYRAPGLVVTKGDRGLVFDVE